MAVSLKKVSEGGKAVSLTKVKPGLERLVFGAGWNPNATAKAQKIDVDIVAFILGPNGVVTDETDFVYFNWQVHPSGGLTLNKDNRDGEGEGMDEQIDVLLSKLPAHKNEIIFATTIYTDHKFGVIDSSFVCMMDKDSGLELARYDLGDEFEHEDTVITVRLFRGENGGWDCEAIGKGFPGGLGALCAKYGVSVE
jgi:tellurium resistance protein TerD